MPAVVSRAVTIEAMKMEHLLTAPVDGVVESWSTVGDQVAVDQSLARLHSPGDDEKRNQGEPA